MNVAWSPAPPTPAEPMLTAPRQEGEKDPREETLCVNVLFQILEVLKSEFKIANLKEVMNLVDLINKETLIQTGR